MALDSIAVENTVADLAKLVRDHIGIKSASSTPLIPHTQLSAIPRGNYVVTNSVDRRNLNVASVSLSQLAAIVATLISDLQVTKVLGGTTGVGGTLTGVETVPVGVYY